MSEQSRRDVLRGLVSSVALSGVSRVDGSEQQQVPELDDGLPFWVVLYSAADYDNPDRAAGFLEPAIRLIKPAEMDIMTARRLVRESARGEYDEDVLEYQAALAWGKTR